MTMYLAGNFVNMKKMKFTNLKAIHPHYVLLRCYFETQCCPTHNLTFMEPQKYQTDVCCAVLCCAVLWHITCNAYKFYSNSIHTSFCFVFQTTTLYLSTFHSFIHIYYNYFIQSGRGSSVGIATELRAGRSGIESPWGRDFPPVQTGPGAHQASCSMGTGCFPGIKCGRSVLLTTHHLLVPRSWKSRAIPLPTLWATPGL